MPKIYLSETIGNPHHDYEVCDGQQRLKAFWAFMDDEFALGDQSRAILGHDLAGKHFSQLSPRFKRIIENFQLVIAIIKDATPDEKRTLFARLQMGVVLTPPELRNAIASAIGSFINTVVETNDYFLNCRIPNKRFKRQDILAHALALSLYDNQHDLKASLLTGLYEKYPTNFDQSVAQRTSQVLEWLHNINQAASARINTKWGFVDLFWFLWKRIGTIQSVDVTKFAKAFTDFEIERLNHNAAPEMLLTRRPMNLPLYEYIQAFNTSGALTDRLAKRQKVIEQQFSRYLHQRNSS